MSYSIATPATEEAVLQALLEKVKAHCKITFNHDDEYLIDLTATALKSIQAECWRNFINATVTLKLDHWPCGPIFLPLPPSVSVTSIYYLDSDGTSTEWASSKYIHDSIGEPGRIALAENESYPTLDERIQPITVTYIAGYGTAASDIPRELQVAITMLVKLWYSERMPVARAMVFQIPKTVDYLIELYRFRGENVLHSVE